MFIISSTVEETEKIGVKIGEKLKGDEVIALFGGLGAGKTALTRGIAGAFGAKEQVCSPTFAIVNEYKGEKGSIFHFDMYRISGAEDLDSTGFYEYLNKGLVIIEWSENIKNEIPEGAINIFIEPMEDENKRKIKMEGIKLC